MDQEKHGGRRVSTGESEDDLRAVLEEAERRKESEWKRTGRFASLMIWVPVLLLLAWAGVFLVQYPSGEDQNAAVKPVVVVAGVATPATQDPKEMAELNAFLPPALRGGKAASETRAPRICRVGGDGSMAALCRWRQVNRCGRSARIAAASFFGIVPEGFVSRTRSRKRRSRRASTRRLRSS